MKNEKSNWNVYKISFEDGFEYVGITRYSVPDRIRRHIQKPINAELSRRLTIELPYVYTRLHTDIEDVTEAHRLESQEIRKLEKPINISGVDPEKAVDFGHPQTPENIRRRMYAVSKRARNVYPPRKGRYACSICEIRKAHTEFHLDRTRFNGLNSRCKSCNNQRDRRKRAGLPCTTDDIRNALEKGEVIEAAVHERRWTDTEKEIVRRGGKSTAELGLMLDRTRNAVSQMRYKLGVSSDRPHKKWSPAEIQKLRSLVEMGMKKKDIAKKMRRTYASVSGKLRKLKERLDE